MEIPLLEALSQYVLVNSVVVGVVAGAIGAILRGVLDSRNTRRQRQERIFETLMATRAQTLAAAHVEAFNAIPVAFHGVSDVIDRWRDYYGHLHKEHLSIEVWNVERQKLMTALLLTMAKPLGYKFNSADIDSVYYPRGHGSLEADQLSVLRGLSTALSSGALTIRVVPDDNAGDDSRK
jgi:hypothetical protein